VRVGHRPAEDHHGHHKDHAGPVGKEPRFQSTAVTCTVPAGPDRETAATEHCSRWCRGTASGRTRGVGLRAPLARKRWLRSGATSAPSSWWLRASQSELRNPLGPTAARRSTESPCWWRQPDWTPQPAQPRHHAASDPTRSRSAGPRRPGSAPRPGDRPPSALLRLFDLHHPGEHLILVVRWRSSPPIKVIEPTPNRRSTPPG
jgi:hypothetical protein